MKANKHIMNIQPYRPGKPIDEVKRELGLKDVIKLASNENPYGPSPKVLRAIAQEAKSINRYPDAGCFYLRKELSKKLRVKEDQLIFGNGSDEIIVLAIRAFVKEGDEVVVARPSFLIYDIASRIAGAKVRAVPLKDFHYDLNGMVQAVSRKTKIVFIGNPDNPAGTFVSKDDLKVFLNKIGSNVLVFLDEAYFEYVIDKQYPDGVNLLKTYKNLIVTRTFSKMFGLAGLRVGYGIANKNVIDILNRIREPFNVNSIAQVAAVACLKDKAYYRRVAKLIEAQRQLLYKQLSRMGVSYLESATNFILIDTKTKSTKIVNDLMKKGVIVRDMVFWGLNSYIRVSIGSEKENRRFLKSLQAVLKKIGK